VFTREELIAKFSLEGVNQASGVFDPAKLLWMNGLYMRNLKIEDFVARAWHFVEKAGISIRKADFETLAPHIQERVKVLTEVPGMVDFLDEKPLERQMDAMFQKGMDADKVKQVLTLALQRLEGLTDFSVSEIDQALRSVASELGLKPGPAFVALRIAVTGKTVTPPLFESFAVLGRDRVLSRIRETLNLVQGSN
jgi:glutamyl-tRNA synthetase